MNTPNTRLLATLVANTALLCAFTASADETWHTEQSTIHVHLRGLDPTTAVGSYGLYREIVSAANRICGRPRRNGAGIAGRADQKDAKRCKEEAITGAVRIVYATFGIDLELAAATLSQAPAVANAAGR